MTNDKKEIASIIATTVFDVIVVTAIVILMILDKIETEYGLAFIALVAGLWKKMQSSGTLKQPPNGLVMTAILPVIDVIRKMKGFVLPLAVMVASLHCGACSSTPLLSNISTALDTMVTETNPMIMTVQATCAAHEWKVVNTTGDKSEILKIRSECDSLYAAHDDFIKAYETVVEAIDGEDESLILSSFLNTQSKA